MVRTMLTLVASVAFCGAAVPAMAGGCSGCAKVAESNEGFCCGKGKAFGVKMNSKKLYTALAGHKIQEDKIKCYGCEGATKKGPYPWAKSDAHLHQASQRYMVKMFLLELWKQWRTFEGLEVRPSYQEEYLGHKHNEAA